MSPHHKMALFVWSIAGLLAYLARSETLEQPTAPRQWLREIALAALCGPAAFVWVVAAWILMRKEKP